MRKKRVAYSNAPSIDNRVVLQHLRPPGFAAGKRLPKKCLREVVADLRWGQPGERVVNGMCSIEVLTYIRVHFRPQTAEFAERLDRFQCPSQRRNIGISQTEPLKRVSGQTRLFLSQRSQWAIQKIGQSCIGLGLTVSNQKNLHHVLVYPFTPKNRLTPVSQARSG